MKLIFTILFFALSINTITAQNYCIDNRFAQTAFFDSTDIRVDTGIIYAIAPNLFTLYNDTLKMDVFYPKASVDTLSQRPFILTIHGGSFMAGSRQDMAYVCMEFARRGFVAATITYRLGWGCSATDLLSICSNCSSKNADAMTATYCASQDARAAMRYIHANVASYKIDADNLFIGGVSAGSITALHTAFWDQAEANQFAPWAYSLAGALDSSGNSLPVNYNIRGVVDDCGAVSKDSIVLNNGYIPVISFHDDNDCVVPMNYGRVMSCFCQSFYSGAGSAVIYNKLTANNICAELNVVPGSYNHCSYPALQLVKRSSCFLKRIMCNNCQSLSTTNINLPVDCDTITANAIADIEVSNNFFSIIPNPANAQITIHISESLLTTGKEENTLNVIDITGRNIYSAQLVTGKTNLDISHWSDGIYFCKITSGNKTFAQKIIISH